MSNTIQNGDPSPDQPASPEREQGQQPDLGAPDLSIPSDEEVAAISRTIEPGSAAPSRANVTGNGSGADNG